MESVKSRKKLSLGKNSHAFEVVCGTWCNCEGIGATGECISKQVNEYLRCRGRPKKGLGVKGNERSVEIKWNITTGVASESCRWQVIWRRLLEAHALTLESYNSSPTGYCSRLGLFVCFLEILSLPLFLLFSGLVFFFDILLEIFDWGYLQNFDFGYFLLAFYLILEHIKINYSIWGNKILRIEIFFSWLEDSSVYFFSKLHFSFFSFQAYEVNLS